MKIVTIQPSAKLLLKIRAKTVNCVDSTGVRGYT